MQCLIHPNLQQCYHEGDLLVKQFVYSLQICAFDWYMNLKYESIDSWNQMKHKDNYFFRPTISIMEFTNTKQ